MVATLFKNIWSLSSSCSAFFKVIKNPLGRRNFKRIFLIQTSSFRELSLCPTKILYWNMSATQFCWKASNVSESNESINTHTHTQNTNYIQPSIHKMQKFLRPKQLLIMTEKWTSISKLNKSSVLVERFKFKKFLQLALSINMSLFQCLSKNCVPRLQVFHRFLPLLRHFLYGWLIVAQLRCCCVQHGEEVPDCLHPLIRYLLYGWLQVV